MRVQLQSDYSMTLVENQFIDRFMPSANGEFVKVYLYMLRLACSGADISVSSIADFFDHTEKDVTRALCYWEKQGLLRLVRDGEHAISEVYFLSCANAGQRASADNIPLQVQPAVISVTAIPEPADSQQPAAGLTGNVVSDSSVSAVSTTGFSPAAPAAEPSEREIPARNTITPARRRQLKDQMDFRQLIFVSETYFGRPLTPTELNTFLYFYDGLKFSCELIEYLVEYCVSKGETGMRTRYMEKIAMDWYRKNITTVAAAKEEGSSMFGQYHQILGYLGISGRNPVDREKTIMDRWTKDWGFSAQLIQEACSRTVLQTAQPSLSYADSILKSWHENGACTIEDIAQLDAAHVSRKTGTTHAKTAPDREASSQIAIAGKGSGGRGSAANRFNNFDQRSYDYTALEQQLMQAQIRE